MVSLQNPSIKTERNWKVGILRIASSRDDIEVVAVNDPFIDSKYMPQEYSKPEVTKAVNKEADGGPKGLLHWKQATSKKPVHKNHKNTVEQEKNGDVGVVNRPDIFGLKILMKWAEFNLLAKCLNVLIRRSNFEPKVG